MMTLATVLLAVALFFLWRRKADWGWGVVLAVIVIGIVIFARDVDFGTNLGIQL
ncbi:MAG: hypothetical protein LJE67_00630 [Salaquimonas sp.]|nr:hypothetical protein [Salaquimonas sp.]